MAYGISNTSCENKIDKKKTKRLSSVNEDDKPLCFRNLFLKHLLEL